ncbi:hypothetical protein J3R83DRAFT_9330 [Lanmaoa asiatica]|nr:hypothetical protein J3R83DRAFT_9330 [Lanmaoa asiatica]
MHETPTGALASTSTGVRLKPIPGFFNITYGRFSADSNFFACAHGDGVVQVWELPSAPCKHDGTCHHYGTGIPTRKRRSGWGSNESCVEIRLVKNGEVVHRIKCSRSKVLAFAVPNEALIIIVGYSGSVFVWDLSCFSPKLFNGVKISSNSLMAIDVPAPPT